MKTVILKFFILISIFAISCNQSKKKNISETDSITDTLFIAREQKRIQREEDHKIDSIRLVEMLKEAVSIASKNINSNGFEKIYEITPDSNSMTFKVDIRIDNFFSKMERHLIIYRSSSWATYINIYLIKDLKFKPMINHVQEGMTYESDSIKDVNGDGLNDFVVDWYGSTGCCLKGFSDVYLQRADYESFSKSFEFINPTFSPNEKVIRGVCYGQPGETEMYKYKWNGEKVDTLEYISYERNKDGKTGKIISSNVRPYRNNIKIFKRLNEIPTEYKNINGYEWFTGKNLN